MLGRGCEKPAKVGPMTEWARFKSADGRVRFGVLEENRIVEYEGDLFDEPRPTGATIPRETVTLQTPCAPTKIVALWNNFHALAAKLGKQAPVHPLFLIKPGSSVAGPGDSILRPASYKGKMAYEGELGIVIGRHCKDVAESEGTDYIFCYPC